MRLSTDTDGTRYLKNYGKNGTLYDADAFSSNHIYQDGVTQYTPLQLGNTLDADSKQTATVGTGWTDNGGHSYSGASASSDLSNLSSTGTTVLISFTISNYVSGDVEGFSSNGTYYIIVTDEALTGNAFTGDVLINSVQTYTITSASNTYYNPTTKLFTKETAFTPIADSLGNVCHKQENGFSHWVAWDTEPTTADIDAMNADHDLIGRIWTNSESLPSGLVAANIQHYYPGNEGSIDNDFVQDITIAYGSELVTNGTFDTDLSGWSYDVNEFRWDAATKSAEDYSSVLSIGMTQSITTTIGSIYKIKADFSSVSGGNPSIQMDSSLIRQYSINKTVVGYFIATSTSHTLKIIGTAALFFVDNISVKEVSAAEIQNYTSNCRTNFLNVSHGPSNLKFTQDATGRLTGYVGDNLLAFNGNSRYCDTGWVPPSNSPWEIDFVMQCENDGIFKWSGIFSLSSSNYLIFGQSNTGRIELYIGDQYVQSSLAVTNGLHHIRIEFDGAGNGNLVIDNSETLSFLSSTYTYSSLESVFIGITSRSKVPYLNPLSFPCGNFIGVNNTRTSTERTAAYAAAKTIYPTLP